ncbi:hypothetical protein SUGI_1128450 [Cryptomeria japonica]|nr:hypothetical protein SUGI_1128450 [Cryptomeria japonica]
MVKSGTKIVPIFYYVDPIDLRYVAQRKGMYVGAFDRHKKKRRYSRVKLHECRDALYNASFYNGEIVKSHADEMRPLKNIVKIVVNEKRNAPLLVTKNPGALHETIENFENEFAECDQDVQIVVIWGMGG